MKYRFRCLESDIKAAGSFDVASSLLKPGKKIFFRVIDAPPELEVERESGYNMKFVSYSETRFDGSVPLRIYHIAHNSKVVLLTHRRETDNQRIFDFLGDLCSQDELYEKLEYLKEYPDKWTASTEDRERHPINIIESIINRISNVESLEKGGTDWELPIAKSALCLYILYTCIETLAAPFIPYNNWLKSRISKDEVNEVIEKYKHQSLSDFLINIHEYYLDKYGMTRSIKEFFNNLDPILQRKFINSIIVFENEPVAKGPKLLTSLNEAVSFLLDFRNSFAHGFVSKYSIPTVSEAEDQYIQNYSGTVFGSYQEIYRNGSFRTYMTRNLLGTMKLIIRHALWDWIQSQ